MKLNKLEIKFGTRASPQIIEWPAVEARPAALRVLTPGGLLWIPIDRWHNSAASPRPHWSMNAVTQAECDEDLERVLKFLRELTASHGDERVALASVEPGKTEKSRTVKVRVLVQAPGKSPRSLLRRKSAPTSLLEQVDGVWTLPVWFVQKNFLGTFESVERLPWPGMAAIEEQLRQTCAAAKAAVQAEQSKRAESLVREAEERARAQMRQAEKEAAHCAEMARLRVLAEEDGELAFAYARRNMTLQGISKEAKIGDRQWPQWLPNDGLDLPVDTGLSFAKEPAFAFLGRVVEVVRRDPQFATWRGRHGDRKGQLLKPRTKPAPKEPDQVVEDCVVHWVEWVGPSKSRKRVDHEATGCRVEVFGAKRLVYLADGRVLTKMAGPNLKVIDRAAAGAQ